MSDPPRADATPAGVAQLLDEARRTPGLALQLLRSSDLLRPSVTLAPPLALPLTSPLPLVPRRRRRRDEYVPRLMDARRPLLAVLESANVVHDGSNEDGTWCPSCGALVGPVFEYSSSSSGGRKYWCCSGGTVAVRDAPPYPDELRSLLIGNGDGDARRASDVEHFQRLIRLYNNAFAFTSLGVELDRDLMRATGGAYSFRVHGQLYHRMGALLPSPGSQPRWSQIYLLGSREEQLDARIQAFDGIREAPIDTALRRDILSIVQDCLAIVNPFIRAYKSNASRIRDDEAVTLRLRVVDPSESGTNRHTYNRPSADDVAVLVPVSCQERSSKREVVVQRLSDGSFQFIPSNSPLYLPLMYPLLFPFGEAGWAPYSAGDGDNSVEVVEDGRYRGDVRNVERLRGRGDGCAAWYRYLLFERCDAFNPILASGRLFHQFVVDGYAAYEANNLAWLRNNQDGLRAHLYSGLMDASASDGTAPASGIGVPVILPSSFVGGPRYMRERLMDALALARRFGHPSLFITVTCNPRWPEILARLRFGQTTTDRPDIAVVVFQQKLRALIDDLTGRRLGNSSGIFGSVAAYTWVVEFQKRGLPHAHILLILEPSFSIRSAADVDACCRAEIPDASVEPDLYRLVSDHMLHGPCSEDMMPLPPCRQADPRSCRFGFPKSFLEESSLNTDSYANYRRRDNGVTIYKRGGPTAPLTSYTNRDVVPYNALLLSRYRCHCNVEVCSSIKAYKYIFKYVFKGVDRATAELSAGDDNGSGISTGPVDEIRQYVDSRYFSAQEAIWRFFRFSVNARYPAVVRLALHEKEQQSVLFRAVGSVRDVASRPQIRGAAETTLTGFFSFNASVKARLAAAEPVADWEQAATFRTLYQDWPEFLKWGGPLGGKCWSLKRGGKTAIGRMYTCGPIAGQRFYLRILLLHVPGFSSFDDARTVDDRRYDTFKEACVARALISDDRDKDFALDDAASFASGYQQRLLFVYIVVYDEVADPQGLWLRHREDLTDDCAHLLQKHYSVHHPTEQQRFDYGLQMIRQEVQRLKGSLDGIGLPSPSRLLPSVRGVEGELAWGSLMETINDGHADLEQALAMKERMTPSQRRAYDALMTALAGRSDAKVFFLYGSGGTGKTFLQNAVRAEMVSREVGSAVCVASTGIAATLLSGGLTAHRFFKIPLSCDETSYCNIKKGSVEAASIEALRLIFWDEAVMTDRRIFDTVDRSLRDLRGCDDPFGGAVVCFCGDFRQILPVVPRGSRADIVASNITNARFWRDGRVEVLRLTENMRLRQPDVDGPTGDRVSAFTQLLTHLGDEGSIGNDGRVTGLEYLLIRGPSSVDELSRFVYDDVAARSHDPSYFYDHAILTSRTHVVTDANARMLQQLPGSVFTAYSHDELRGDGGSANTNVPIETLHSFEDPSIPAHAIPLKRNCPVMVMRNVDTARRVCNGTRLQVIRFSRHTLYCRRLRPYGPSRPTTEADFVLLKRITFDAPGNAFLPLRRKQFPIRLCFAMTINKSQGQSFNRVGLMLDPPIFSHGQLYVALSRVTAPDGIRIASDEEAARTGRVSNIVWPEVFQSVRVSDVN